MSRKPLFLALFLVSFSHVAALAEEKKIPIVHTIAWSHKTDHNLKIPEVYVDEVVKFRVKVINDSTENLNLHSFESGCGCTAWHREEAEESIASGDETLLELWFRGKAVGTQSVLTSFGFGEKGFNISVLADIKPRFTQSTREVEIANGLVSISLKKHTPSKVTGFSIVPSVWKTVSLEDSQNQVTATFEVRDLDCSSVKLIPVDGDDQYKPMYFEVKRPNHIASVMKRIKVNAGQSQVRVFLRGDVEALTKLKQISIGGTVVDAEVSVRGNVAIVSFTNFLDVGDHSLNVKAGDKSFPLNFSVR